MPWDGYRTASGWPGLARSNATTACSEVSVTGAVSLPEVRAKVSSEGSDPAPDAGCTTWTLSANEAMSPRAIRP